MTPGPSNRLYHNNGDGTFTRILTGPVVTQPVATFGNNSFAAADVDRDGFQDLLWVDFNGNSQLFHNDGNVNGWLSVRCEGRISNRAAIGAKVRVGAWFADRWLTQMREIGGGGLVFTQNEPVAAFGLGVATNAALVHIEWPSGIIQQFTDAGTRRFLHAIEPAVRISPAATNVPAGSTVTFHLLAAETNADVQWFFNGVPIAGATNLTLTVSGIRREHLGRYTAQVGEPAASVTYESAAAMLGGEVVAASAVKTHFVRHGSNLTLSVSASGIPPLGYQWFQRDAPLPGATQPALLVTNIQIADEGTYSVAISNSYGGIMTAQGEVVVLVRPALTVQPLGQNTVTNGSVSFSASAIGHPMPLTFRWRRDGLTFTNITVYGSNTFLTIRSVQPEITNRLNITVGVTNLAGLSAVSSNAIVVLEADTDGDRLPDDWETAHSLDPADPQDATLDTDSDGISNFDEFMSGTNPRNAAEFLRLDRLTLAGQTWRATFRGQSNCTYTIQQNTQPGDRWSNVWHFVATPSNGVFEASGPLSGRHRFFRVKAPAAD